MSGKKQTLEPLAKAERKRKAKAPEGKATGLPAGPEGTTLHSEDIEAQAAMLQRIPASQRQASMQQISQTQGNSHVQRLVAAMRQAGPAAPPAQRAPEEKEELQTSSLAEPGTVQRFAEGPHEEIEHEALRGDFGGAELNEIALGNWQNDFNQISLAGPYLEQYMGIKLSQDDFFDIAAIIAEAKLGEKIAKQMSKDRFGSYKPAQHYDNPSGPNDALEQKAVPKYISDTTDYMKKTFDNAIKAGETPVGREYYGSALHIMEDFFAHSNFVEIALNLSTQSVDTQGGVVESGADAGRLRLSSGIFETLDTVVSMLKIVASYMNKPPEPGKAIGTSDRIILILLKKKSEWLANRYQQYLQLVFAAKQYVPEWLTKVAQGAKAWVSSKLAGLIEKLSGALAKKTGTGIQPSHSKINKDDSSRPRYNLAKELALQSVKEINPKMMAVWRASTPAAREAARAGLFELVDKFTQHPDRCDWWRPIVAK